MTTATMIRRRVDRAPAGSFLHVSDFAALPRDAVDSAFSRLARSRRDFVRLRNGIYWKGVKSRFGAGRPDPVEAALAVAGRGAGPAGLSAANALGLTTQVAARPTVAVLGRCPTGIAEVHFVSRSNPERRSLRGLEIALLEVLREFPLHVEGDWDDLVRRVADLMSEDRLRIDAVARVGLLEHSPAARDRVATLRDALSARGRRRSRS